MNEEMLDALAREMYHVRSQSPREMTDERWENIKQKVPGSVRRCREDVIVHHPELVGATAYDQARARGDEE
jgi:hypothetical protein